MENKQPNPPRLTAMAWWIITALSVFGVFIPLIFDTKISPGGILVALFCLILAVIGIIIAIIYTIRAGKLDYILKGDNLLAHWTYEPDEWQQYAEEEYTLQKARNRTLFVIITIAALVCGFGYWVFNPIIGKWAFITMAAVIVLSGFVAWFTTSYNHRQNKNNQGQAFFTHDAIYINRQLHDFKGLGSRLEKTEIKGEHQKYIEFVYSVPTRNGRQRQEARVPIPRGREAEANNLVERYNQ